MQLCLFTFSKALNTFVTLTLTSLLALPSSSSQSIPMHLTRSATMVLKMCPSFCFLRSRAMAWVIFFWPASWGYPREVVGQKAWQQGRRNNQMTPSRCKCPSWDPWTYWGSPWSWWMLGSHGEAGRWHSRHGLQGLFQGWSCLSCWPGKTCQKWRSKGCASGWWTLGEGTACLISSPWCNFQHWLCPQWGSTFDLTPTPATAWCFHHCDCAW